MWTLSPPSFREWTVARDRCPRRGRHTERSRRRGRSSVSAVRTFRGSRTRRDAFELLSRPRAAPRIVDAREAGRTTARAVSFPFRRIGTARRGRSHAAGPTPGGRGSDTPKRVHRMTTPRAFRPRRRSRALRGEAGARGTQRCDGGGCSQRRTPEGFHVGGLENLGRVLKWGCCGHELELKHVEW